MNSNNVTAGKYQLIVVFVFCLLCVQLVKAQDVRKPPQVVAPSPEAASLGRYGSWPVSLYTGIPQVSAPLYTIDYRGFKLPVGLSYHASGIKIEDIASWVATGWALEAGGVVTRTVMGLEDDNPHGFYNNSYRSGVLPDTFDVVNNDQTYKFFTDVTGDREDTEPDVFNFNFGGISGQFYFDRTGTVRTIPASNIIVKRHPLNAFDLSASKYWEIVDDKGITYILGQDNAVEKTTMMDDDQMFHKEGKTAWYLNKIILPNKQDSITFQYVDKYERYSTKPSQSYRIPDGSVQASSPVSVDVMIANGYGYSRQLGEGPYSALTINQGKVQLSAISWRYGKVSFYANTGRKDITGQLLDSVNVLDAGGQIVKRFGFRYNNNITRPFLTSIVEKSITDLDTLERYRFDYYEGLPGRFSNSQDEWGYYNGSSNKHLVPYDPYVTEFAYNLFATPDANRAVSKDHMMAGTLKTIYYPTKGSTEFSFEPNRYRSIDDQGTTPGRDGYYTNKTINMSAYQQNAVKKDVQEIIVEKQSTGGELSNLKIQIRNYYRGPGLEESYLPKITFEEKYFNTTTNQDDYRVIYRFNAYDDWEQAKSRVKYNEAREDLDFDLSLLLGAGHFRVTTEIACFSFTGACPTFDYQTTINASYTFSTFIPPVPGSGPNSIVNLAGGLRIKQITNYDVDGKIASAKQYTYNTMEGSNIVSSGTLLVKPRFFSYTIQPFICSGANDANCRPETVNVGIFTSGSLAVLGVTQGGYVGYEEVTEQDDTEGKNGQTVYKYSMAKNEYEQPYMNRLYSYTLNKWPVYIPNTDNSYKRGLLLEKTVSAKEGTTFKTVAREKYSYLLNDYEGAPNYYSSRYVRIRRISDSLGTCCGLQPPATERKSWRDKEFIYTFYNIKSPWVQMVSKSVMQDDVETKILYEYNNLQSMQPTREIVYTSAGDSVVKTYKYPTDIIAAGQDYNGTLSRMVSRNIVTPVIEEETVKNAAVSKVRSTYKDWLNNGNLLLQDSVLVKYANNAPYHDVLIYNGYDVYGNILSYSANSTPVNFLWGYDQQYPVAKVTGSSYDRISSMVTGTLLNNPSSDQALHTELNKIRSEKALLQSYAYQPLIGISSETNPQGKTAYYSYDGFGRLLSVRDHNNKLIKAYSYNYGVNGELIFSSDEQVGTYVKSTCGQGYMGEVVNYIVPKGTYSSTVSQADANQKAINDVRANGQLYADINGRCNYIYYNTEASVTLNRNNCTGDGEGTAVTYTVPARKYTSIVSQQNADSLAADDITKNAQSYVNTNGKCIYYNAERSQTFTKSCGADGEGSQVVYLVPARKYSAYSQAEADALVQADINTNGQAKADAEGICTYYNSMQSQAFNPVCGANYKNIGPVTYTVAARKYSSNISKADANQKALNEITANGQAYANVNGCICTGEGYKIVNNRCELGTRVQIESHREGDKWACTYYYQFTDGTLSANYTGLGEQQCQPPIEQ